MFASRTPGPSLSSRGVGQAVREDSRPISINTCM